MTRRPPISTPFPYTTLFRSAHEKGTLEAVVNARSRAMAAQGPAAKGEAEGILAGALKNLFALAEAYPQLRAGQNPFRDRKSTRLNSSHSQISYAVFCLKKKK